MRKHIPIENLTGNGENIEGRCLSQPLNRHTSKKTAFLKLGTGARFLCKPVACLMFVMLSISIQATARQPRVTNGKIVERLTAIERDNQRLKEDIIELEGKHADLKEKNKELEAGLKRYEPFKFWAWILGGLGVGSILGLTWLYFKVIPGKVNSQVDEIIAKILTDRREDFLGLLKEYDFENSVKRRHQIVLLSHRNGSDDYHHRMLSKNGFQVKAFTRLEQLQQAVFNPDDILVINNDGNHWPADQIQDFINAHPNYCFYFGKGVINPESARLDRFAAANFRTQFIGNLMNVLKYSHHQN
ncbi:NARF domain-containing protein [Rufibacter sp. XAAS-G3-1]|uniref:NARF domain-containing protein n=1 Tax=Rufibacter sp. XAAS-G3-1 TaxID=2729134 RepID=UPI0015E7980F|nr:NARF domain-containing protein [Rufibacter sp. XAAS-G3-1]